MDRGDSTNNCSRAGPSYEAIKVLNLAKRNTICNKQVKTKTWISHHLRNSNLQSSN